MRRTALGLGLMLGIMTVSFTAGARASAPPVNFGSNVAALAQQAPVRWVSVAQIENSLLGRPPMAVGFDIDDTVLFSSPGFRRGQKAYSPGSQDYLKNPAFWEKMNNGWDEFSIPKETGRALVAMHVKRGDCIYFITGRSPTRTETLTRTLQRDLAIPAVNMNPVIFAGDQPGEQNKTQLLRDRRIKIYYGDADSDIRAAREAGVRGIRLLRAANSTAKPLPQAGTLGEEVVVNSEY